MRGRGRAIPRNHVHEEPRTADGRGGGASLAQGSGQGGAAAALALSRPLHACPWLEQGVDGTLLEAWASHKSYRPRDEPGPPTGGGRNRDVDPRSRRGQAFQGERRSRDTHESATDPEVRL